MVSSHLQMQVQSMRQAAIMSSHHTRSQWNLSSSTEKQRQQQTKFMSTDRHGKCICLQPMRQSHFQGLSLLGEGLWYLFVPAGAVCAVRDDE
mmetsp:Transcript_36984/g.54397  ORF Transcript_36984/g.54397 Transcript_36984/m.54397 type:complete len:92 (-) Transcript_36984:656-931(-)